MAITFDDLPAHGERPRDVSRLQIAQSVLATLKAEHMPPTYGFINGIRTKEAPATLAVLEAWRAAGQPLGNHTWSHPDLSTTSVEDFEADILKNEPLLEKRMPAKNDWHWFRYPFLDEGDTVEKHRAIRAFLAEHHYQVAEVTQDFEDYLWNAPYTRCVAKHDDAAIAHLHDTYLATAESYLETYRTLAKQLYGRDIKYVLLLHLGAFDAKMLPELLAMYRAHGFSFISLPEAIVDPAYKDDADTAVAVSGAAYAGNGALTEQMTYVRKLKFPKNAKPVKELDATRR